MPPNLQAKEAPAFLVGPKVLLEKGNFLSENYGLIRSEAPKLDSAPQFYLLLKFLKLGQLLFLELFLTSVVEERYEAELKRLGLSALE